MCIRIPPLLVPVITPKQFWKTVSAGGPPVNIWNWQSLTIGRGTMVSASRILRLDIYDACLCLWVYYSDPALNGARPRLLFNEPVFNYWKHGKLRMEAFFLRRQKILMLVHLHITYNRSLIGNHKKAINTRCIVWN